MDFTKIQALFRGFLTRSAIAALRDRVSNPCNFIDPITQCPIPNTIGSFLIRDGTHVFQFPLHTMVFYLSHTRNTDPVNPYTRTRLPETVNARIQYLFRIRRCPSLTMLFHYVQWPYIQVNNHKRIEQIKRARRILYSTKRIV